MRFEIIVQPTADGPYLARSPQAPGRYATAETPQLAFAFMKASLKAWLDRLQKRQPWQQVKATFAWRLVNAARGTASDR
jgi:predicted RNase H-like HicB family nuclease